MELDAAPARAEGAGPAAGGLVCNDLAVLRGLRWKGGLIYALRFWPLAPPLKSIRIAYRHGQSNSVDLIGGGAQHGEDGLGMSGASFWAGTGAVDWLPSVWRKVARGAVHGGRTPSQWQRLPSFNAPPPLAPPSQGERCAARAGPRSARMPPVMQTLTCPSGFLSPRERRLECAAGRRPRVGGSLAIVSFLFNWPSTGGGNHHTAELAKFLAKAGYEVKHSFAQFPGWGIGKIADVLISPSEAILFMSRAGTSRRFRPVSPGR